MDEQQRKALLKETFDTVSAGYDGRALRFFPESAKHLAACLDLRGDAVTGQRIEHGRKTTEDRRKR
jgi:hypothetical protein